MCIIMIQIIYAMQIENTRVVKVILAVHNHKNDGSVLLKYSTWGRERGVYNGNKYNNYF